MSADTLRVAEHVAGARFDDLPPEVVAKVKTFLLDTLGVGMAGSSGAKVADLAKLARSWGGESEATVWLTGERMSAQSAAIVNAYQIHCLEFDCVHEGAVLHPMATILSAVFAWSERESAKGREVSGRDLIAALAVGVDVSTMLGLATKAPIRFFRPATAGGFGAAAAIARLMGMEPQQVMDALGAQYSQTSGTLQPHVEGSPMLGMQVGFNARAAIVSCDLAAAGFRGPHDILTGRYGYLPMFEGDYDLEPVLATLGHDWQILAMSHKPWPSGRLTHGVIDGLGQLMARHGFAAADVAEVTARVPPLNHRLVGRPDIANPEPNYAKLCLAYVAGAFLARGRVEVPEFRAPVLSDPAVHDFANRVTVELDTDNQDQNALNPQVIGVRLNSGAVHAISLPHVYGHPENPLTGAENEAKFRRCLSYAVRPAKSEQADRIIAAVAGLEAIDDISVLARLTVAGDA